MKTIAMIPARLDSERLPEKLMMDLGGLPIILRTYQNVVNSRLFDEVHVITDSQIILYQLKNSLYMAHYQSSITLFLNQLKQKNPEIEKGQIAGRALLWDKPPVSLDEQRRMKLAKIPQKAYVYSND